MPPLSTYRHSTPTRMPLVQPCREQSPWEKGCHHLCGQAQKRISEFGAGISMSASAFAPAHSRDTRSVAAALSTSIRAASSAYSSLSISIPKAVCVPAPPCLRMMASSAMMKQRGETISPWITPLFTGKGSLYTVSPAAVLILTRAYAFE